MSNQRLIQVMAETLASTADLTDTQHCVDELRTAGFHEWAIDDHLLDAIDTAQTLRQYNLQIYGRGAA